MGLPSGRVAARLTAEGHDLDDLGLMQINQRNFGWLGPAAGAALEPYGL